MPKQNTGKKMILITVHLTKHQLKMLDMLVEKRIFPNRSEAIREAVRRLIEYYMSRSEESFAGRLYLAL